MSTSTSNQPPPFTDEERRYIAAVVFNYNVHEKAAATTLKKEHRLIYMTGELRNTPVRTEPEIRAELLRLCEDFRRPDREPRPWDIFLCPPLKKNDDFTNQLEHYLTLFEMTYSNHIHARRIQCNDGLRAARENPEAVPGKRHYEEVLKSLDDIDQNMYRGWPHPQERSKVIAHVEGYTGL